MIKKIFLKSKSFLTIFFSILFTFVFIELLLKSYPSIVPTMGWQTNNLIHEKIRICQKDVIDKVVVFGDSFIEFYGKSNTNLVQKLNNKSKEVKFCNFGMSGTDIHDYINRFLLVKEEIKVKKALFFLYEGNDFKDHLFYGHYLEKEIFTYDKNKAKNRNLGTLRNFIKSTYTINILYRHIIKRYIYKPNKINNNTIKILYDEISERGKIENSIEQAIEKHENFSKDKLKLINSDTVNRLFYYTSLFYPNYYNKPNPEIFTKQKKVVYSQFNYINNQCKIFGINCKFIIIPEANFVSEKFREEFFNFFEFNSNHEILKKSLIVEELLRDFNNVYYPDKSFEYKNYLRLDAHLSNSGNEKLSEYALKILNM